jgi:hypothetical protein
MKIETLTWTTPAGIAWKPKQPSEPTCCNGMQIGCVPVCPHWMWNDRFEEEIEELRDAFYHDRLQPYIEAFYRTTPGKPGLPMRVVQHIEVHRRAEEALRRELGIVRPRPVAFDLAKFIGMYERGQLGGWGGAFSPIQTEN